VAAFGEIGLTGELRYVAHPERRTAEAAKFGLQPAAGDARTLRAALQAVMGGRERERAVA
jgi:DNA repair protein RadA/Sms